MVSRENEREEKKVTVTGERGDGGGVGCWEGGENKKEEEVKEKEERKEEEKEDEDE